MTSDFSWNWDKLSADKKLSQSTLQKPLLSIKKMFQVIHENYLFPLNYRLKCLILINLFANQYHVNSDIAFIKILIVYN